MDIDTNIKQQSLKDDMRNVLEEARMILPGIQALFGLAFAIDVYVVAVAAIDNHVAGACGAAATVVILTSLWFLFPLHSRRANGNG